METALHKSCSTKEKFSEVLKPNDQPNQQDLKLKVENHIDHSLSVNQAFIFPHSQLSFATHTGFQLNHGVTVPRCTKEDSVILEKVHNNIENYSFNTQTLSKLLIIHNFQEERSLRTSASGQKYLEFVQDISKRLYKKKHLNITSFENEVQDAEENIRSIMDNSSKLLTHDLLNDSILATTTSLYEIIDRLTDSEDIQNCIIISAHHFIHPLNWFLSPAAWAISFFNSQVIHAKKLKKDELYYTKHTLPRVTYLSLTGIFSEMDINVLHDSSENIQTISIYDENTGGPNILRSSHSLKDPKKSKQKKNFQQISDKILLLPLRCKKNSDDSAKKDYGSNEILQLIEYAVVSSITKFKPAYIVLNVSLIFDESDNQTPFAINTEALGHIVHLLAKMTDSKVLVYPFKLPNMKNKETSDLFTKVKAHIDDKGELERMDYILNRYGIPYNQLYLRDSIVKAFEVLSNQYDLNLFHRLKLRKDDKINPSMHDMCYQIGRFYKEHSYYKFLYSKTLNTISKVASRGLIALSDEPPEFSKEMTNSILLHVPGKPASKVSLKAAAKEIVLTKDSQYLVEYSKTEVPTVFIFNARTYMKDEQYGIKTFAEMSHFCVYFEMEEKQCVLTKFSPIELEGIEKEEIMKDCGLCKCENFVFQVYGTDINKNEESNRINYFDFETGEKFSLGLTEEQKRDILPRYSVTACAFKRDNRYYLYVFGGQIRSAATWKGKSFVSLDIFDFVEVYETEDPRSGLWEYKLLPKENNTCADKSTSFIPFYQSFAFYDEANKKILLIGGKTFESSVYNWTCPVFEFDTINNRFSSFQIFLNHIKDDPNITRIRKNLYRATFMTTAIASPNRNVYYDQKDNAYKFIIPLDYEDIVCVYTCDPIQGKCDYSETQIHPAEIKTKGTLLEKSITAQSQQRERPLLINPRVATLLNYSFPFLMHRKVLLELTKWRLKKDEEVLANPVIDVEWKKIVKRMEEEAKKNPADKAEMEITIMEWSSFREFEDIFMKRDNRLEKLREYLTIQICLNILKTLEDILAFREFTDYIADKISGKTKKKQDDSFSSKSLSTTASTMDSSTRISKSTSVSLGEGEAKDFKKKTYIFIRRWIKHLENYRDTKSIDKKDFDTLIDESTELESTMDTLESMSRIDVSLSSEMQGYKGVSQPQDIFESMTELGKNLKRRAEYNLRTDPSNLNRIINELKLLLDNNKEFFAVDPDPNNIFELEKEEQPSKILEQSMIEKDPLTKSIEILKGCSVKGDDIIIESDKSSKLIEGLASASEQPRVQFLYKCFVQLKDFKQEKHDEKSFESVIGEGLKLEAELKEGDKMKELIGSMVGTLKLLSDREQRKDINMGLIDNLITSMNPIVEESFKSHDESTRAESMSVDKDNSSVVSGAKRTGGQEISAEESREETSLKEENKENIQNKEKSKKAAEAKKVPKEEEKHGIQAATDTSIIHNQSLSFLRKENDQSVSFSNNKNILDEILEHKSEQKEKKNTSVQYAQTIDSRPFQECLSASNVYRTILNGPRSEIILAVEEDKEYKLKARLRFALTRIDPDSKNLFLETFSLDHSPSSIYIKGEAVLCYLDKKTKTRYPDLFGDYGCWVLYADMSFSVVSSPYGEDVKFLVFSKLFKVTQDDHIYQRSLVVTENYIGLFGGKSMKKKNNTITNHKEILMYSVKKYSYGQVDSSFKVTDVDPMNNGGECIAIAHGKFIYVCKRESPSDLEIFTEDGLLETSATLPESHKNHTVSMSLVNIKDKAKIMLTFSLKDKDRKFMLFDIKKKDFEEEEPKLKPKQKGEEEIGFLCSGFEEFDVNSSTDHMKNEVILYNYRDTEQINVCNIETT